MHSRAAVAVLFILLAIVMGIVQAVAQETFHSLRTPNFEVRYQAGIPEQDARKVSEYLEQDYTYLSKVLGMTLEARPEVRIYDSEMKFGKGSGGRNTSRGVSSSRGIIHVKPVSKLEKENQFAQGFSMELPMVLLAQAIRLGCPQWLAQSFAVYHSGVMPDLSPPTGKKLRYFSDLDQNIQDHPDPPQRRDVEFLLGTTMKFLAETFGEEEAFQLFKKFDGVTPIEEIFRTSFGKEYKTIEEAWVAHMTAAVGDLPSRSGRKN